MDKFYPLFTVSKFNTNLHNINALPLFVHKVDFTDVAVSKRVQTAVLGGGIH
jgi:hypothetical protein